jgi:1-acyl-sn-glycerol-3-phosphate acyltransferase
MQHLLRPAFQRLIRLCVYHIAVGALFAAYFIMLPAIMMPRRFIKKAIDKYIKIRLFILEHVWNIRYEIRGIENIPRVPVLLVSKHQSLWDSLVLPVLLGDPAVISKKE